MSQDSDYQAIVLAESTLLNYWTLGEALGATSLAASAGGVAITPGASTAKPLFGVPGVMTGGTAIRFDGINDFAQSAASIDLTAYSKVVLEFAMSRTAFTQANAIALEFGTNSASVNGAFGYNADASNSRAQALHKGSVGVASAEYTRPDAGAFALFHIVYDKTLSTNEVSMWVNGVQLTPLARQFNNNNLDAFGNFVLNLGARNAASLFANLSLQHVAIYSDLADARKIAHSIAMGFPDPAASNTSLNFTLADLSYNGRTSSDTPTQNELSSIKFTTNATQIQINGTTDLQPSNAAMARFGVIVNGVTQSQLQFAGNGSSTLTATIAPYPSNTVRTVEIVSGPQLLSGTVKTATIDITPITVVGASATLVSPPTAARIVAYGTSIDGGFATTQQNYDGWATVLRRTSNRNILIEAWGSRQLYDDIGSSNVLNTTKSQAFANRIASYNPAVFFSTTGINDWNLAASWGKTAFCAAYVDFLTRLRALLPNVPFIIVSPLAYSNEALTNSFGETIGDWRLAIAAAVVTVPGVQYHDGFPVVNASKLADSVHYTTAGHLDIAAAYDSFLLPLLSVTGTADNGTYDFGSTPINTPITNTFTIANYGGSSDVLGTLSISGTGWSITGTNPSGQTIIPAQSTTVTVTGNFASSGSKTGILTIPSNDAASPYVINLAATVTSGGGGTMSDKFYKRKKLIAGRYI